MATKWKNKLSFLACILLFTFGANGLLSGIEDAGGFLKKDYFHTEEFQYELNQFINDLSTFELNYLSKEEAKRALTVTAEEIEEHRYYYGSLPEQIANIKAQYEHKILEAREANSPEIEQMYIEERDTKIEDITNNFKSDEHVRKKILKEKEQILDEYFLELENHRQGFLKSKNNYTYYLKDTATGDVYTNLLSANDDLETVFSQENNLYVHNFSKGAQGYLFAEGRYLYPTYTYYERKVSPYRNEIVRELSFDYQEVLPSRKAESTYTGYIAVPKSVSASSSLMQAYHDYQYRQMVFLIYLLSALAALLLSIFMYKRVVVLNTLPVQEWEPYYHRLPLDLRVFAFAISALLTWIGLTSSLPLYYSENMIMKLIDILIHLGVTAFLLLATLLQGIYLRSRWKDKSKLVEEWQASLAYSFYRALTDAFLNRKLGTQLILLLGIVFGFGAGAIAVLVEEELILIYIPAFLLVGLPTLYILLRWAGYLNRIVQHAEELVQGQMEPDIEVKGKSVLATLASNINDLKHGVKQSQKEQMKSERLKTELITNVSHDLRTPLTSIITYTELLKSNDLTAEDREAYVQIIDRKSKRLKVLIDDLFEVSKMASGNMELSRERVDLVQLLKQALAEHNETIDSSNLIFRVNHPNHPVYALVDGQKIWRVFDNLIGNILKYSLENTRVYITVETMVDQVIITFKNITKYELGENIEEMFERFKRGDTSRHTEGSGLGLAIAKSIVDLHEGNLEIEVDGDLFKVTVALPER